MRSVQLSDFVGRAQLKTSACDIQCYAVLSVLDTHRNRNGPWQRLLLLIGLVMFFSPHRLN